MEGRLLRGRHRLQPARAVDVRDFADGFGVFRPDGRDQQHVRAVAAAVEIGRGVFGGHGRGEGPEVLPKLDAAVDAVPQSPPARVREDAAAAKGGGRIPTDPGTTRRSRRSPASRPWLRPRPALRRPRSARHEGQRFGRVRCRVTPAEGRRAVMPTPFSLEDREPAVIGAADGDAVVAGGGLDIQVFKLRFPENAAVGHRVQRHTAGVSQVFRGAEPMPVIHQIEQRPLQLVLHPAGDVCVILETCPEILGAATRAIEPGHPVVMDEHAAVAQSEYRIGEHSGPAVGRQPHQFAGIVDAAQAVTTARPVEAADRVLRGLRAHRVVAHLIAPRGIVLGDRQQTAAVEIVVAVLLEMEVVQGRVMVRGPGNMRRSGRGPRRRRCRSHRPPARPLRRRAPFQLRCKRGPGDGRS